MCKSFPLVKDLGRGFFLLCLRLLMNNKINWKALCVTLFILTAKLVVTPALAQKIDKAAFYAAMTSGSKDDIDKQLAGLTSDSEQGYAGALTIRKAGLPKAKERLKLFKAGKAKLEAAIAADPENTELHFLRLSIQEHSPKIVKYKADLEADKAFVIKHFAKLSLVVQHAVKDYSKDSKILKPEDFN